MSMERFHKAAKEGLIDVLKEATRKDCNARDEQGMTPTLYAAFYGHLEALRLICGKGGDPEKADYFGNTALHLAATQGHKSVVTFLVNFGVNVYAMDIDEHTPQELAGIYNKEDILRFLDSVTAKLDASDRRKAKTLKDKARKESDKRIKEFNKRQAKADAQVLKYQKHNIDYSKPSVINTLKLRIKSGSMSNLNSLGPQSARHNFSTIVNGGSLTGTKGFTGTVQRKILANRQKLQPADKDFKVSKIEDGKRSIRSITGLRRDSEIMYGETFENNSLRSQLGNIFNDTYSKDNSSKQVSQKNGKNLTRSHSQPDFLQELNNSEGMHNHEPSSMFNRPGIGSLAFRKSIINTLPPNEIADESSIGSAGSLAARQRQFASQSYDDDLSDAASSDEEQIYSPLEMFLTAWGLGEYISQFEEQKVDLDTLMLLTEADLRTLNLPLGPYRKLVTAISERKNALEHPGAITDSQL